MTHEGFELAEERLHALPCERTGLNEFRALVSGMRDRPHEAFRAQAVQGLRAGGGADGEDGEQVAARDRRSVMIMEQTQDFDVEWAPPHFEADIADRTGEVSMHPDLINGRGVEGQHRGYVSSLSLSKRDNAVRFSERHSSGSPLMGEDHTDTLYPRLTEEADSHPGDAVGVNAGRTNAGIWYDVGSNWLNGFDDGSKFLAPTVGET